MILGRYRLSCIQRPYLDLERLDLPRAQVADAEAIYFIEPTTANVDFLLKDYDMVTASYKPSGCCERLIYGGEIAVPGVKSNMYGKVHLVFQGGLNDTLFARIK